MMIQNSGKNAHMAQKSYFYQNTANKQHWTLTQLSCSIFLLKIGENIWGYRKCQKIEV